MRSNKPASERHLDASFERFVVESSPRLLRVAFLLTSDRQDAEDLLQAGLVRVLSRWRQIADHPDPYVLQVLVNLSRDRRRWLERRPRESFRTTPIQRRPASRAWFVAEHAARSAAPCSESKRPQAQLMRGSVVAAIVLGGTRARSWRSAERRDALARRSSSMF